MGSGNEGPMYAELHCLTNFSFQRGASHPRELVEQARLLGYRALAVTDECSLAGVVRAWEAAKTLELPLIIGSEFQLADAPKIVLLAPTQAAYEQLCALITKARRRSEKGRYHIELADLDGSTSQLLALWIPRWPRQGFEEESMLSEARAIHERFERRSWIAWERHLHGEDRSRHEMLGAIGRHLDMPLVAAGDVHMHVRERKPLQDVLACVRAHTQIDDPAAPLFANAERCLRPLKKLERLYPKALLAETLAIAERCDFRLDQLRYQYPSEVVPECETPASHLRKLTLEGLKVRYPDGTPPAVMETIEKELSLIAELRYEHYFLTVEDIVRFARGEGILCQGRGSAANSAVCYALGVTEVDPARMNLLFERFLSRERNEPPDIDIDFEHQRREEVMQYLYRKYGRDRAALTATVISYRRRSALRDVGKTLGFSLEQVDELAKASAYWDDGDQLRISMQAAGFDLRSRRVQQWLLLSEELIGFPRHLSQHVGGFVISNRPLSTLVPVENAAMEDRTIIQWDKDDLDVVGLLKVDILALGMLSAIRRTLDLMSRFHGRTYRMQDIPAEDPATYDMISRGETTGVFQIESRAQMSMLPRMQPRTFWDLVIEVAIIRPGPIQGDMVHPYLRRRQGLEPVTYPSAALEKVLSCTLGVPLFQEQVMSVAMVAAGFNAGEADQVRRSMAAWKRKGGLQQYQDKLMEGMAARGYSREFADQIFQQILGFGSYGFPMSHAASFALLTYVSCWMRCHEPAAFCAALLNSQPMGFYAPAQLVNDTRRSGVKFRPPDVQHSDWNCTLERGEDGRAEVRLGLRQINGMPAAEAQGLVDSRGNRPFASVDEMAERARLSRRSLNCLAEAGALASLAGHRHAARWSAAGVHRMGSVLQGGHHPEATIALPVPHEAQDLTADYRSLGLTLGRHPMALLRSRFNRERVIRSDDLKRVRDGSPVRVAGVVTHRQRPGTASGVVFATLEDEVGVINLIVWSGVLDEQREAILGSQLMLVDGTLQAEQGVIHVITRTAYDYSDWLGRLGTSSRDFH